MTDAAFKTAEAKLERQATVAPTLRQMTALWVPLAASIVMMVLEPSIINIGLGRTPDPELALAAYGVAFSLALLVEAPILMLIDTSVARATDLQAFRLIRRFTVILSLIVTAIGLAVSCTPLYGLIVEDVMNIPADVAAWGRVTLQILSFWPAPIAWRRTYQGVLIRAGRTTSITIATGARLVVLAIGLIGGLILLPEGGAVVAGLAMEASVVTEAAVVTWAARPVLRAEPFRSGAAGQGSPPPTMRELWQFYRPLAVSTLLRQITRPVLNAGIAATELARASLAAWPVAWGLTLLIAGPTWSLQQLTTALVTDETAYRRVRGFSISLSVFFSLVFGVVAFTPLYGLVMGGVYNLSPELQEVARPATQLMILYPLLMGAQSLVRGVLIRGGCTGAVRTAVVAYAVALAGMVAAGVVFSSLSGAVVAAVAVMVGTLAEMAWLYWRRRC